MIERNGGLMEDTISRKMAINAICEHGTELERRGITVLAVANYKQVTVDLLEALPSTQPETHEKRTETHECDCISRQAAIDYFVTNVGFHDENGYPIDDSDELRKIWTDYFDGIPSAQPKIIRCKDCMYWVAHDKRCVYLNHGFAPNMWCCHGRRADG